MFYKLVGENPLDQIDWIIEHGLNKFNYWFRLYETNKLYNPATVEEYIENQFELRGGLGNQRIDGGHQLREYDGKSGTWRII